MKNIDLSIVIPFYNEKENLPELHKELLTILEPLKKTFEIIYVDDGSIDQSDDGLRSAINNKKIDNVEVKEVTLTRNFGQTAATAAGIDNSNGRLIGFLDADLQNDPHDLIKFFGEMDKGYDAILGWRKDRRDTSGRSAASKIANFLIRRVFDVPIHDVGCSLRIVKREILENMHLYGEAHRILPVLIYWKSSKVIEMETNHRKRLYGQSKYGYSRVLKLIIDLITVKFLNNYGTKPAYVFGAVGIICSMLGGLILMIVAYNKFVNGIYVYLQPLFLVAIFLILVGLQFILMGLLAELLIRTYYESQKKTIYEIRK